MESAGAILKKIRLEKGLSLEEVHKKTKIHLNILRAIEEDSVINISPVYIKGFLKIYCKFLGVDPRDYIQDYKQTEDNLSIGKTSAQDTREARPSFFKSASVKIISLKPRVKIKMVIIGLVIIAAVAALFHLGKSISLKRTSSSLRFKSDKIVSAKTEKKAAKHSQTTPKINTGTINLGILAKDDCWLTLKADGRIVFHAPLKKGKFESWQAKEKIEFSVNNAQGIELEVNGQRFSNLGRKGQAKNVLINKEGLKVQ